MKSLKQLNYKGKLLTDTALNPFTTYRVGGKAKYVYKPETIEAFLEAVDFCRSQQLPFLILGNGSNVLLSDGNFKGMAIVTTDLKNYSFRDDLLIADAGCSLIALAYQAAALSLSGLEFASGIPGSVGGGLYMNAGAYNRSLSDILRDVLVYRGGKLHWMKKEDLEFAYRSTPFQKHKDWIILQARFELEKSDQQKIYQVMQDRKTRRESTQPVSSRSAGSVFRNPSSIAAWKLVDELGFRGQRRGGAQVSELHSNFIINENGQATYEDITGLIDEIVRAAKKRYEIDLITEIERIDLDEASGTLQPEGS